MIKVPPKMHRLKRAGKAFLITDTLVAGVITAAHEIALHPHIAIPATIMIGLGGVVGFLSYHWEKINE